MSSSNVNSGLEQGQEDVTDQFLNACKSSLGPGDVAHEKYFGLQHAMSAIDIMNPSMDSGMPKERKVTYLLDAVHNGTLPLGSFSDQKLLLGVIDELLVSFVNWLTGDTLVQTVYTCMYMHCTPLIEDPKLSLFCESLRRIIVNVRRLLLTLPVFEEEDFCPMTHRVPCESDTTSAFGDRAVANNLFASEPREIVKMLRKVEDELSTTSNESDECKSAMFLRFKLLRRVLNFLEEFSPILAAGCENEIEDQLNGQDGYSAPFFARPNDSNQDLAQTSFDEASTKLVEISNDIIETCLLMVESSTVGQDAGPGKTSPRTHSFDLPGFEPFMTQAFLPSSIQRFPKTIDRSTAFSFLACAFTRVKTVLEKMRSVFVSNDQHVVLFHQYWAAVHYFGHNYCHSLFKHDESTGKLSVEDACSKSCNLSRGILSICISALSQAPPKIDNRLLDEVGLLNPGFHFLTSWLAIECPRVRNCLLDNLPILYRFGTYFNHVGSQLITVS